MITTVIVAAAILLVVIALSPRFSGRFYRKLVFAPIAAHPGEYSAGTILGITGADVNFRFPGGEQLNAHHFEVPGAPVTVLLSHSNWGNIHEWRALIERLLQCGVSVFAYDYRGFGLSTGVPTVSGICRDGLNAFDYLVYAHGVDPRRIVLYGSSLGSGVSCYIASKRKCGGLILHGGFSSLRDLTVDLIPLTRYVPAPLFFSPSLDNCGTLARLDVPLLVVHGRWDEVASSQTHPLRLYQSARTAKKDLVVLPNCYHMDTNGDAKLFISSVSTFAQSVAATAAN